MKAGQRSTRKDRNERASPPGTKSGVHVAFKYIHMRGIWSSPPKKD